MRSITGGLMILASGALAPAGESSETDRFRDAPLVRLLPPDAIPAIDAPKLVSREEGERFMLAQEPVLVVVAGGEARAYSLWILDSHEIVNDTLGVWRGEAHGPAAFGTRLEERRLRLQPAPEGGLRDDETGTLWDALTGQALEGPLKGRRLLPLPSLEAYWFAWAAYHPGSALAGGAR